MAKFGRKVDRLHEMQLEFIGYVNRKVADSMVTGGWAVEGIHQAKTTFTDIMRPHDNVDFMIAEKYLDELDAAMDKFDMEKHQEPYGNIHAGGKDGLKADMVVLYPHTLNKRKHWVYETPYHNGHFRVPAELLKSTRARVGDVRFRALNPTALYFAKILTKENVDTDMFDAAALKPYTDAAMMKRMMAYARI
jgi:hypothetical protein